MVSKQWNNACNNKFIWNIFSKILTTSYFQKTINEEQIRKKIKIILARSAKNTENDVDFYDLIALSFLGFKKSTDVKNLIQQCKFNNECESDAVYYYFASCSLTINNNDDAEEMMLKMSPKATRSLIAFDLIKKLIEANNFEKAKKLLILTNSPETNLALFLLTESIKKTDDFEYLIQIMKDFESLIENFSDPESAIIAWIETLKAIEMDYWNKKEFSKLEKFKAEFPIVFNPYESI
jgi:hypothetical protein